MAKEYLIKDKDSGELIDVLLLDDDQVDSYKEANPDHLVTDADKELEDIERLLSDDEDY